MSARLSYKYASANEKCQLQITSEIRARTASDMRSQNANFYVAFATCVTINFEQVLSCSRKTYDVNRILQKHKQRALQKIIGGLLSFLPFFVCLLLLSLLKNPIVSPIHKSTAEDG